LRQPIVDSLLTFQGDFYGKSRKCPHCDSENHKKHNVIEKIFCTLIVNGKFKNVTVFVQIFYCKDCHKTYFAESPFYEGVMYSKPIVGLCLFYATQNPFHRTERIFIEHGIQIDRDTIRNYVLKFGNKCKKYAGIKLFGTSVGINFLKIMFDVEDVNELKKKYPYEKYDATADETYPRIKGAKKEFEEKNRERKLEGKEPFKYPKGFTLALSYLAILRFYVSLLINLVPFSQIFANALLQPIDGADLLVTDAHGAYNGSDEKMEHIRCLFHKAKNLAKKDKTLAEMKKDKKPPDEIKKYLSGKYKELEEEILVALRAKFPKFINEKGEFIGALTTNTMEGGNWRIKNELRTPYSRCDSITGRTALICLKDSIFTFREGKPCESFAHKNTNFSFEKIMSL
jgi:transposase-like protein